MSTNRKDIYGYDKIFRRTVERLESEHNVCEENKQNVKKFVEHLIARGISKPRIIKYINHLVVLARIAGKSSQQLGKQDIGCC